MPRNCVAHPKLSGQHPWPANMLSTGLYASALSATAAVSCAIDKCTAAAASSARGQHSPNALPHLRLLRTRVRGPELNLLARRHAALHPGQPHASDAVVAELLGGSD